MNLKSIPINIWNTITEFTYQNYSVVIEILEDDIIRKYFTVALTVFWNKELESGYRLPKGKRKNYQWPLYLILRQDFIKSRWILIVLKKQAFPQTMVITNALWT